MMKVNQELVLETYKTKETDLENEMQLKYNIYTQMTNQLQIARAKLIEKTPVYAVIQPAVVPIKKSGPKRLIIIFTCVLFGGLVYTLPLLYKQL